MFDWVKNKNTDNKNQKKYEEMRNHFQELDTKLLSENQTVQALAKKGLGQQIVYSLVEIQKEELESSSLFVERKMCLIEKMLEEYTTHQGERAADMKRLFSGIQTIRQKTLKMSADDYHNVMEKERLLLEEVNQNQKQDSNIK